MKNLRPLVLALPILLFLSGTGSVQEMAPCRTIAAILSVYPVLDVKMSQGAVRNLRDGTERPGCRVHASGPTSGIAGEVRPEEAVRDLLGQSGWVEDPLYGADGPGTASFAFRTDDVLCTASGGAHSWIENGKIVTADRYEIEAGCVAEPDPSGTGPGR